MANTRRKQSDRGKRTAPSQPNSRNTRLNQQTRRVLGQHYRAKYGVK